MSSECSDQQSTTDGQRSKHASSTSFKPGEYIPPPAPDDPRRCKGKSRESGERCKKWRTPGSDYCIRHGGGHVRNGIRERGRTVANKYRKYAGRTLAERLDEMQQDGNPIKDLTDEIELARSLLIDALALHERCAALPPGEKRISALIEAGRIVQDQIREVSDLVVKMAKVEADTASVPQLTVARLIVDITRAIAKPIEDAFNAVGLDPGPVVAACGLAIKNVKTVTEADAPDEIDDTVQYARPPASLASDMDETVPFVPLGLPAPASPRDGAEATVKHVAGG